MADEHTDALPRIAPSPPPSSKVGLIVGIGVAVLALSAVGGYIVYDNGKRHDEEVARLAQEAKEKAEAARIAALERAKLEEQQAAAPVALSVTSEPVGAMVTATWKGGSITKESNFVLEVPKNTTVKLVFHKSTYLPYETEMVADGAKLVTARLTADPKAAVAVQHTERARPPRRPSRPQAEALPDNPDSTIPVDFGDDIDPDKGKKK
jgi:hypothetical protein